MRRPRRGVAAAVAVLAVTAVSGLVAVAPAAAATPAVTSPTQFAPVGDGMPVQFAPVGQAGPVQFAPVGQAVPTQFGEQPSYLRLAHLSPDTPNVDVYLTAVDDPEQTITVPGVGYGAVSDYRSLPPATYTVAMRAAGAPADSPPVISTTLSTESAAAYTVAGTGLYSDLGLTVLNDELAPADADQARVRVINAAATSPQIDVAVQGGASIAQGVGFAQTSGYESVPVGQWTVDVTPGDGATVALPVDIAENSNYSVLLLDRDGALVAELHQDSTGAGTVPAGGIDTGLGGAGGAGVLVPVTMLAALLIGIAALVTRSRRAARR